MPDTLPNIIVYLKNVLESEEEIRAKVMKNARRTRMLSKQAIMLIHNSEHAHAMNNLEEIKGLRSEMIPLFETVPELEFFEEVKAAQEEYAEALIFQTLLKDESYLTPEEVGVKPSRYLMGLGDVPGELRREVLTALKKGDIEIAEELLGLMEDIYFNLVTCETLSLLSRGLRRKIDITRGVLERTRSDITTEIGHQRLIKRINPLLQKKI